MTLTVSYAEGTRYDLTNGTHRVVTDQPVEDGGQDAGMSPVELFVGSLASCVGYFVGEFCKRHQISREGLAVEAAWEMAEAPHRVGMIRMAIRLPQAISRDMRERLLAVAHGCTVHQSLAVPPRIVLETESQAEGGATV